jgi:hypothetical protein
MLTDAGFGHLHKLEEAANVIDMTWIADAVRLFAPFFHLSFQVFSNSEFNKAGNRVLAEET